MLARERQSREVRLAQYVRIWTAGVALDAPAVVNRRAFALHVPVKHAASTSGLALRT